MILKHLLLYLTTLFIFSFSKISAQENEAFCKAIAAARFKKSERFIRKIIKQQEKGDEYYNGPGSGIQTSFTHSLDSVTLWLKSQSCVADAYWDKCQTKIAIYPGHSKIGVQFVTKKGNFEKCLYIQEGTVGKWVNIGIWTNQLKGQMKLVYKSMHDCEGFIEQQKLNCNPIELSQ